MKVKTSLKKICEYCYFVNREGTLRRYCKRSRRHNARQGPGGQSPIVKSKKIRK